MSLPKLCRAVLRGSATAAASTVALAAPLAGLVAVPLTAATPAYAAPTHVAIVIAGDKSACVPWQFGMTGDSLLHEVASVTYNASHMINRIDGRPSDGASSVSAYWAYWHDTGSGWTYSSVGASDYSVPAGSVEGWIFGDGSAPPNGSYSSICAGQDPVTPVARSSAAVQPRATSSRRSAATGNQTSGAGSASSQVGTGSTSGPSAAGSSPAAPRASAVHASTKPSAHPAGSTAAAPAGTTTTSPAVPTSSARTDAAALGRPAGHGSTGALGASVAALAAAALAGGAFWARRRRRAG